MLSLSLTGDHHESTSVWRGPVLPRWISRPRPLALIYLAVLSVAEIVTALIDPRLGVVIHALLLVALTVQGAMAAYVASPHRSPTPVGLFSGFTAALALAPLTRIVSLSVPPTELPQATWYALYAIPMLAAACAAIRANRFKREDVGLRFAWRPGAIAGVLGLGLAGIAIGYVEYRILTPDALVETVAPIPLAIAAVSLIFGTGFTEEFIFRGVMQRATVNVFGDWSGITYVAAVFAVLHIGHRSVLDVVFVFLVGLLFGLAVRASGSLAGVIAAHSVTNLCVFLVFPLLSSR
jgi:membrane protease YdiL (CAAX protease family)